MCFTLIDHTDVISLEIICAVVRSTLDVRHLFYELITNTHFEQLLDIFNVGVNEINNLL